MQALENALREDNDARHVACLLTQVEVDPADPAFKNPTEADRSIFIRKTKRRR